MPNNVIYAIVDEPYCLWEQDIQDASNSFLQAIDHRYFEYLVHRVSPDLDDPEMGMRAATSLRLALFHATETLFLLLGALLQGEKCPHAWVGTCSTSELRTLLERIDSGGDLLMLNHRIRKLSWLSIAQETLRLCARHPDANEGAESFARFWELLAINHTDQIHVDEFNSLKHGFRVAHGGFSVEIGTQGRGDITSTPMTSLGSSKWGGAFRVIRKIDGEPKSSRSRVSIRTAVNWDAIAVSAALRLVAASIKNVVSALRVYGGAPQADFEIPSKEEFEAAFKRVELQSMSMPKTQYSEATTKQQIIDVIRTNMGRRLIHALGRVIASKG